MQNVNYFTKIREIVQTFEFEDHGQFKFCFLGNMQVSFVASEGQY